MRYKILELNQLGGEIGYKVQIKEVAGWTDAHYGYWSDLESAQAHVLWQKLTREHEKKNKPVVVERGRI